MAPDICFLKMLDGIEKFLDGATTFPLNVYSSYQNRRQYQQKQSAQTLNNWLKYIRKVQHNQNKFEALVVIELGSKA